ncbi:hypothetical protein [Streptomyces sp. NPDC001717]|uniref:hypothetical protein n=1 Tax=Streptomyces sp. NPDC001717 TaxID=3364604 RepID=UPI0036CF529D
MLGDAPAAGVECVHTQPGVELPLQAGEGVVRRSDGRSGRGVGLGGDAAEQRRERDGGQRGE